MSKQTGSKSKKKDICLWVVDGKSNVRKYRLSYFKLSMFAGFFTLLGALIFLVAGDYTRIQISRVKNFLLLQQLESERNALEKSNSKLAGEITDLKELNSKVMAYEQNVKSKLFEISKVIESATSVDVLGENEDSETAMPIEEGGVGGAELDCTNGNAAERCKISSWSDVGLRGRLDPELVASPQQLAMLPSLQSKNSFHPQEDLVEKMDRFIEVIKELPLGNPATGKITSGFGKRISPFTRHLSLHEGIDISLDRGTDVLATGPGKVTAVERHATYGLMIDIEHNEKITTRYAHLNKALVNIGQIVKPGEVIGLSGSTGKSTGPHLHYEVLVDSKAKNPKNFLSLRENLKSTL